MAIDSEIVSRPRFLIINGDDFGFSRGVNQGIIKAHDITCTDDY